MRNYKSGSTTILGIVCAIIFVIFSIHYIYSFQGDILGMMQYAWSDHQTHYNRLIGFAVIFPILIIVTYLFSLCCHFPPRLKALIYMPAMIIMGQITSVSVDDAGAVTMPLYPAWVSVLLLLIFPFLSKWIAKIHTSSLLPHDAESALQWLTNGIVMAILMVLTYSIGNTDRNLHTRLAIERLCHEGRYVEALAEGTPLYDHGTAMTMWRALALSHQEKQDSVKFNMLGERLFTYNIDGDRPLLLPNKSVEPHALLFDCYPIWQAIGFVPRNINENPEKYLNREIKRHKVRQAAKDYLLCTYLLRKDLQAFVKELPKFYNVKASLPQHYREALVLYYALPSCPSNMAKDSVNLDNALFEDYSDFQDMLHAPGSKTVKNSKIRDNYFGTYWYYYYRD